jgi:HlyD family secretion protein
VVILVPDLDVPFVDPGDPATIEVDALKGEVFHGKVARIANSEDAQKLMRTEVDLPNPRNRLRDGMYGKVSLEVEPPSDNLTIPSSCLTVLKAGGDGVVYVIRDGKAHRQAVRAGRDDGARVEILEGLDPDDQVIVRYTGSIAEGVAVKTEPIAAPRASGKG